MRLEDAWSIESHDHCVVVAGDMDLVTPAALRSAIAAAPGGAIELDLSGVVFMDWPGLRVLLDVRLDNPLLRIVAASARVRDVLATSGTADYLSNAREASPGLAETQE